ncbi:metalloregulator ArsR/SmtB family transcription factor [Henriciella sp.]|uniref:ArsR/SmtB family transcription factor n=1 Tax=Henriciella sp. TaxID=1968823 RepID=UPI002607AB8F|nr:metalloregulator ArsR/SmtB family transcription factor [Henriciella sp.]
MADALQSSLHALADPTRREIISILTGGEARLGEIAERFDMTRPAIAKHLGVLKAGGLIEVEARGRERIHRLKPGGLAPVLDWVGYYSAFWDHKLDRLKQAIEADDEETGHE